MLCSEFCKFFVFVYINGKYYKVYTRLPYKRSMTQFFMFRICLLFCLIRWFFFVRFIFMLQQMFFFQFEKFAQFRIGIIIVNKQKKCATIVRRSSNLNELRLVRYVRYGFIRNVLFFFSLVFGTTFYFFYLKIYQTFLFSIIKCDLFALSLVLLRQYFFFFQISQKHTNDEHDQHTIILNGSIVFDLNFFTFVFISLMKIEYAQSLMAGENVFVRFYAQFSLNEIINSIAKWKIKKKYNYIYAQWQHTFYTAKRSS